MNAIELKLFTSRVTAICDEMGLVLRRAAFSPNIKDRLDFSCALFGPDGELFAQAAHIPVHLGSMAFAMQSIVSGQDWCRGDMLILNDPFLGGTHLPDVTVIAPVFHGTSDRPCGFVANRAHHADIGCDTPGSMPISTHLEEEGIVIPPSWLLRDGGLVASTMELLGMTADQLSGDLAAQVGANHVGVERLQALLGQLGYERYEQGMQELNNYADRITASMLQTLVSGEYRFEDYLDDDGQGTECIKLALKMTITPEQVLLDFAGSAQQVPGNLNCPLSVVAAAAYYCFRCLMPAEAPACAGLFRRIIIRAPVGSIVNAERPAAVAAGNVETSMRLVDVVFGALAGAMSGHIPAASQGTMNNIAMGASAGAGAPRWDYYETLAGGIGGGPNFPGLDAAHSHMTNTLNTPIESLELHYPLRVREYSVRRNSGGMGLNKGGNGITREYEFLAPAQLSLLTERRRLQPWSLAAGGGGSSGQNLLNGTVLPGKCCVQVKAGDRLTVHTPGGGGWGQIESA